MVTPTTPGVFIQEVPSGVRTITGVATSVALFVGRTERGVLEKPTLVTSFTEYERRFGSGTQQSELTEQVRQFFQNGGQQAYIIRTAFDAKVATSKLENIDGSQVVLELEALEAGTLGNALRVEVDYDTATPESTFNLRLFRLVLNQFGELEEQEEETFSNLSMNPAAPNYVETVVNSNSNLVSVLDPNREAEDTGGSPDVDRINGYSLSGQMFAEDAADPPPEAAALFSSGTVDSFQISVDGSQFVTATPSSAAAADILSEVNDKLSPLPGSPSVTVAYVPGPTGKEHLEIRSALAGDGGSIRIIPAASQDMAIPFELGDAQGGMEVDGFGTRRPAPTGGFLSAIGADLDTRAALNTIGAITVDDLTEFTLTEPTITKVVTLDGLVTAGATDPLYLGATATGSSLRNVREKFDAIAASVNAAAAADPAFDWRAEVHGLRLVFTRNSGNSNFTATSFSTDDTGDDIGGNTETNVRHYSLGSGGTGDFQVPGQDGLDGEKPKLENYDDAFQAADREIDVFNIIILPRDADQSDPDRIALWGPASVFAQQRRAFLLIDPPEAWDEVADVISGPVGINTLRVGVVKDHAAVFWPRIEIPINGTGVKELDPSGTVAGIMARTDGNRGVWKAPAGLEADLRGITGVDVALSDADNGQLNPQAVNALRVFAAGIVVWGSRTMDGFDNSGNLDFKFVPVRRFTLFLSESIRRGIQFAVFEPNAEPLWAQLRLAITSFMNNLFRQGAFAGETAREAFFVKVDSETTTQDDINRGVVNVLVGFAPLKPAEFIIVRIQQLAGQVQV